MKRVVLALVFVVFGSAVVLADEPKVTTVTASVVDGVQRVEIRGGDYYFEPNHIIVKKDIPVELVVKKAPGWVPHDIVMDAPQAGMAFKLEFDKEGEVVKFTPTQAGTFPFYCDKRLLFFKSHKERGMHGEIEVVD